MSTELAEVENRLTKAIDVLNDKLIMILALLPSPPATNVQPSGSGIRFMIKCRGVQRSVEALSNTELIEAAISRCFRFAHLHGGYTIHLTLVGNATIKFPLTNTCATVAGRVMELDIKVPCNQCEDQVSQFGEHNDLAYCMRCAVKLTPRPPLVSVEFKQE